MSRQDLDLELTIGQCKGVLRHAWYPTTTDKRSEMGIVIACRCERGCGRERYMVVHRDGRPITPWRYWHPDKRLYSSITAESMNDWRALYIAKLNGKRKR